MSKIVKLVASVALFAVVFAAAAEARSGHGHRGGHHGGWRGGGWSPYYFGGPRYYAPACGWVRVRVWRRGHWVLRRAWRCW